MSLKNIGKYLHQAASEGTTVYAEIPKGFTRTQFSARMTSLYCRSKYKDTHKLEQEGLKAVSVSKESDQCKSLVAITLTLN